MDEEHACWSKITRTFFQKQHRISHLWQVWHCGIHLLEFVAALFILAFSLQIHFVHDIPKRRCHARMLTHSI
jgi:hypothetical protein